MKTISPTTLRRITIAYFIVLVLAMWLPLGGVPLNRMVLGFRLDHVFHCAIYMLCAPAWAILLPRWHKAVWLLLAVGFGLEMVQYWLPYRGFDLTDMIANATGALIGWIVTIIVIRKK